MLGAHHGDVAAQNVVSFFSQEDEFWHRLECLGEPGGRSAEGCVQSDKQGRACNGSLDSNSEQTQRRGVGAFKLSDHRCCRLSFPTSGTRGPPAATQPTRESALITRARENLLRFSVLFSPPSSLPSADSPHAWAGLGRLVKAQLDE